MSPSSVTPALYRTTVRHARHGTAHRGDVRRVFRHRIYTWLVGLDALPRMPRWLRPFARFDPRDHLGGLDWSIRDNVDAWLARHGVNLRNGRIVMLAHARVLGYVFNPITIFWCYHEDEVLACVLLEVHNTYGKLHCYLLRPNENGAAQTGKDFFVSPFLPQHGIYRVTVPAPDDTLRVVVQLRPDEAALFTASMHGRRRTANPARLAALVLAQPLVPQRVAAAIRAHGTALWLRGMPRATRKPHRRREGT